MTASFAFSVETTQRWFSARFRALRDRRPVLNRNSQSSHKPQTTMVCGEPSGFTVVIQWLWLFFRRPLAHLQGRRPLLPFGSPYPGMCGRLALGSVFLTGTLAAGKEFLHGKRTDFHHGSLARAA